MLKKKKDRALFPSFKKAGKENYVPGNMAVKDLVLCKKSAIEMYAYLKGKIVFVSSRFQNLKASVHA